MHSTWRYNDKLCGLDLKVIEFLKKRQASSPDETWNRVHYADSADIADNKLILGNLGNPMGKEHMSLLVRQCLVKAGIDKRGSCHMLWHTAMTLMLENGADLRSLQTYLGHASLNTT
jgi:site-specific recombinase XerD